MKFLVLNGPNLNLLGKREPEIYGKTTYVELLTAIEAHAAEIGVSVEFFQSNHEGDLIDKIQEADGIFDGIILNAGGYTHTSVSIRDAIAAVSVPTVEVHLTDPDEREDFRRVNFIRPVCTATVSGKGVFSYLEALDILVKR